ncbi:MAG: alpha/beta hydrolase [Leptolyngbyaceae bacterium]|nr:alpha/beta hydrolase [Leptolyngbyaceae bacterium]
MAYISIRGVDHYMEWITEDGDLGHERPPHSSKPVMVFVHGWAGSTRYWRQTARSLSPLFDCLLYDMRGFGRSRLPRPLPDAVAGLGYGLEGYADDLAALLDALKLSTVVINAHSTGASIATVFANRWSDRCQALILTCSGVFEYNKLTFSAFHAVSRYVVGFRPQWFLRIPGLDRLFMVRFLNRPIPPSAYREFLEDFVEADHESALGTVYTAVSERAAREMPEEFRQLHIPTLLVSGECDQIIPVKLGRKALAVNPNVEHVVIPKTGHFPMLEDADTYLTVVNSFLERITLPGGSDRLELA